MRTSKQRLIIICISIFALIAVSFAVLFSCVDFSKKQNDFNMNISLKSQPDDTNKYWDDSTELSGWISENRKEDVWAGSGTEEDPWLIQSEEDLAWLAYLINNVKYSSQYITGYYTYFDRYFMQTKDLDMSKYWWCPIGAAYVNNSSRTRYFSANYNGDSHVVRGIFTEAGTASANDYQGLFARAYGYNGDNAKIPEIKNLGVEDSIINGNYYTGGIAGALRNFKLTNCYNKSTVNGSNRYVGGLIGRLYDNAEIAYCFNSGSITGLMGVAGGLIGMNEASGSVDIWIYNSYNTGTITSGTMVGGLVGRVNEGIISNCYNTGTVVQQNSSTEYPYAGGIAGVLYTGEIRNCYNVGSISGESYLGGITASIHNTSVLENCFNIGSVSGGEFMGGVISDSLDDSTYTNCYYGGLCTLNKGIYFSSTDTTQKMSITNAKTQSWVKDNLKWDFDSTWTMNSNKNSGYPIIMGRQEVKIDLNGGQIDKIEGVNLFANLQDLGSEASPKTGNMILYYVKDKNIYVSSDSQNYDDHYGWTEIYVNLTAGKKYKFSLKAVSMNSSVLNSTIGFGLFSTEASDYYFRDVEVVNSTTIPTISEFEFTCAESAKYYIRFDSNLNNAKFRIYDLKLVELQTSNTTLSGIADSQFSLPNPTREGYDFAGWKLSGGGDIKSGKCAATGNYQETQKVDIDGTVYTNFNITGTKTTEDNWPCALRFDTFAFIHNHEYELSYQIRVNSISLGFQVRFSRLDNDWESLANAFNEETDGWVKCTAVKTLKATDTFNGGEIITNPRIEFNSDSTKWATADNWVIDIDMKNIVVKDITNNTIAWSAQKYTFGTSNGTLTAQWTEKTWDEYAADSFAGGTGSPTDPYQISTPAELGLLAKQSKQEPIKVVGNYYKLTSNIDLSAHAWGGIGNINNPFTSSFDGNFRCISNIRMQNHSHAGLFNVAYGATITQVILQNGEITSINGDAGGIVGHGGQDGNDDSRINKCIVENVNIKSLNNTTSVGGITGSWGAIGNCTFKNGKIEGGYAAGISGYNGASMDACSVLNATIVGSQSCKIITRVDTYVGACYGYGTLNGSNVKLIYHYNTVSWRNEWVYASSVNDGYPLQQSFFWMGTSAGSVYVDRYLKNTLGFTVVS